MYGPGVKANFLRLLQTVKRGWPLPLGAIRNQRSLLFLGNFVDAIRSGAPLRCPGEDGLGSIELANAMVFSSLTNATVDLPLDGAAYEKFLAGLIANSKTAKRVIETSAEDFSKSFRK